MKSQGIHIFHKPISSKQIIPIVVGSVCPDELRMLADCGVGLNKLNPDDMQKKQTSLIQDGLNQGP